MISIITLSLLERLQALDAELPVIMVTGGSLGAVAVNEAVRGALPLLLTDFQLLHLCGKGKVEASLLDTPGYRQFEFISTELPDVFAASDLVVSRAGANAIFEFLALAKPMLLIPLPRSASRGDQILNAQSYERRGLANVLLQEDMTAESLIAALKKLLEQAPTLRAALEEAPAADGTEAVLALIEQVQKP